MPYPNHAMRTRWRQPMPSLSSTVASIGHGMVLLTAIVSGAIVSSWPVSVAAQQTTSESRGFISINGGFQAANGFTGTVPVTLFVEEGSLTASAFQSSRALAVSNLNTFRVHGPDGTG